MAQAKGILYLLPVPLGESVNETDLQATRLLLPQIRHFIVERGKTARRMIRQLWPEAPLQEMTFFELDKHDDLQQIEPFLKPALEGKPIGLMSEAGCPGVADPGALIVAKAHDLGIMVSPLVGPSSLLLALMASGMSGQQFAFHGYLPVKGPDRKQAIRRLEQQMLRIGQTQIFIETPYRNEAMLEALIQNLQANTRLCVAVDLTQPNEWIGSFSVKRWKKEKRPDLKKRPAVFLIGK